MKRKNEIDNLFARKLRDAELTPRDEAWQKLQARMQQKERRLAWVSYQPWLAAAGVSVLLVAGWLLLDKSDIVPNPDAQVAVTQPKREPSKSQAIKQNKPADEQAVSSTESGSTAPIAGNPTVSSSPLATAKRAPKVQTMQPEKQLVAEVAQPKVKIEEVKSVTAMSEQPKIEVTLPTKPPVEIAVAKVEASRVEKPANDRTVVLKLPDVNETLAALPTEDNSTAQTDVEPKITKKESRFSRLMRQLKNAKNGEKVEWDEVGINPNSVLARANRKMEQNRESDKEK